MTLLTMEALKQKISALPVIAAPMFLISDPKLLIACCHEGIVGSFPALNQRSSEGLAAWLTEITAELSPHDAPYAVNLIVNKTNPRLDGDLALCVQHRVPIVITSLGASEDVVNAVHGYGGLVLHDVTTAAHARKAVEVGVDGLVAVAAGAGGHAGTLSPFVLMDEIRSFYDGFVALAGGISTGRDIAAARMMGADAAYMGTRFIATAESAADPAYKHMICDAGSGDIVYTSAVSGIPANFLRQSLEQAGYTEEELKAAAATQMKSLEHEAKAWKNIWSAGQGVAAIDDVPSVRELAARLKAGL